MWLALTGLVENTSININIDTIGGIILSRG